jgi:hypothetical protein
MKEAKVNRITQSVIGAAIEVHRILGPGLNLLMKSVCVMNSD